MNLRHGSFTILWVLLVLALSLTPARAAETVTFWTQSATNQTLLDILDEFTQETGIVVELRAIGWGTDELVVAAAADASPDVWTHGEAALGFFASSGLVSPLTAHVDRWPFAKDMAPQARQALEYQGELVALPFRGYAVRDLLYRADLFEEAGLGADNPPIHWEDLIAYGKKLVKLSNDGAMARSAINQGDRQMFFMFMNQSGSTLFEEGRPMLDSQAAERGLAFLVDLIHQHRLVDLGFSARILDGTSAMEWAGASHFARATSDIAPMLKVATFPYSDQPATFGAVDFLALSPSAKNPVNGLALLEYLLHPDRQERLSLDAGQVPIYGQAVNWDWVRDSSYMPHFIQAINHVKYQGYPAETFFEVRDAITEAVTNAVNLAEEPRNALLQANQKIFGILGQ